MSRKCKNPNCNNFLSETQKFYCCNSCKAKNSQLGKKLTDEHKNKISNSCKLSNCGNYIRRSETLQKMRDAKMGKITTEETKSKIKKALIEVYKSKEIRNKCISKGFLNHKHSNESKNKMRIAALNYIEKTKGPLRTRIGNFETQLLNEQEIKDNCKIQRQFRIKSLGYIVDGYCHESNTVYEVYEPLHDKQIEHDKQRQEEIQKYLNCNFKIIQTTPNQ